MSSEMVQRIAKIIWHEQRGLIIPWEQAPELQRRSVTETARHAIAAMREPTEAMTEAGCQVAYGAVADTQERGGGIMASLPFTRKVIPIYEAMISAALADDKVTAP